MILALSHGGHMGANHHDTGTDRQVEFYLSVLDQKTGINEWLDCEPLNGWDTEYILFWRHRFPRIVPSRG